MISLHPCIIDYDCVHSIVDAEVVHEGVHTAAILALSTLPKILLNGMLWGDKRAFCDFVLSPKMCMLQAITWP